MDHTPEGARVSGDNTNGGSEPKDVCVLGAGYVGLVTACGLARLRHRVSVFDPDRGRVTALCAGEMPFFEPGVSDLLVEGLSSGRLRFHPNPAEALRNQRYVFVAVPTPNSGNGNVDLSFLRTAVDTIASVAQQEVVVIVKSTVPVGTFSLFSRDSRLHHLTFVANPEFLSEGTAVHDFFHPWRTIIGADSESVAREVALLYAAVPGRFIYTTANTAQMIKYSANSFLATRVAFINEISQLCERLQIDVHNVATALLMDPRLGSGYLNAGVGFAGPCLPKDIAALRSTAESVDAPAQLLTAVSEQNEAHLEYVIKRLSNLLNPSGSLAIFGLSFKPNTDDLRNSFSLRIIRALADAGHNIRATDPRSINSARDLLQSNRVSFHFDPIDCAEGTDLQVFLTPWSGYKEVLLERMLELVRKPHIFDATGMFDEARVKQIGFAYEGVGRHRNGGEADRFVVETGYCDNAGGRPSEAV